MKKSSRPTRAHPPQNDLERLHGQALTAFRNGQLQQALAFMRRALRVASPPTPQTRATLLGDFAEMQRQAGDNAAALHSCEEALRLVPEHPEATLNRGVILFQTGQFVQADAAAQAALLLHPRWLPALLLHADALREQGALHAAQTAYRDVLAQAAPTSPERGAALTNLGWMLVQTGHMDEGLALCQQAAALPSDYALSLQNLGRVLLEYGRLDEAMAALEQALNRAPNVPMLSLLIGRAWDELGDADEARHWLGRALQLDDNLHEARVALASLEADHDSFDAALTLLEQVLTAAPERVDALQVKARVRLQLGDVDGAVADHRAAIALQPNNAGLLAALGSTLSSAGDIDGALIQQRRAIALNPHCVPAYAGLLTTLRHKASDAARDATLALLQAPWMTDMRRSSLHFGLAAYYDGRAEWATAAEHMVQANARRKAAETQRHHVYDPAQYEAFVDKLIATFTPDLFARLRGLGSPSERPVFIVGMPRSGTTLTEQIIASHPMAFGAGERTFANRGLGSLGNVLTFMAHGERLSGADAAPNRSPITVPVQNHAPAPAASPLDSLRQLADLSDDAKVRDMLNTVAQWHLAQLDGLDGGAALRVVDKMPDNFSMLGWLACLFPQARFIHCRRDVRDVALSCWITNFAAIRWANDLDHLAHRIAQYQRLMAHWDKVLPVPVLQLDYEALVADQEGESRRLVAWLGLDWDDRCLSYFKTDRLVRTASVTQVREPIYKRSVARWTHYEAMLAPLLVPEIG
jgi:tetratricopeptide (TPR) repeat protein